MLSEVKRLRGKTQLQYDLDQNKDNDQRKGYVKFRNRHNQILESLSYPSYMLIIDNEQCFKSQPYVLLQNACYMLF